MRTSKNHICRYCGVRVGSMNASALHHDRVHARINDDEWSVASVASSFVDARVTSINLITESGEHYATLTRDQFTRLRRAERERAA